MPIIQAVVKDKVLILDDTCIVCNNGDYVLNFTFDEQFAEVGNLKCRFIFNGIHKDADVSNGSCHVPVITQATEVKVGLFWGEGIATYLASTYATLKCRHSIVRETPAET